MILTIALVSAGVTALLEGAKYLVKKTKTTKDDKVVAFLADHADDLVDFIAKKAGVAEKPVPREKVVDHRAKPSAGK